jgi:hypothetical protein
VYVAGTFWVYHFLRVPRSMNETRENKDTSRVYAWFMTAVVCSRLSLCNVPRVAVGSLH